MQMLGITGLVDVLELVASDDTNATASNVLRPAPSARREDHTFSQQLLTGASDIYTKIESHHMLVK